MQYAPLIASPWAPLAAADTNSETSAVVTHDENPDDIADDTKQEMITETSKFTRRRSRSPIEKEFGFPVISFM